MVGIGWLNKMYIVSDSTHSNAKLHKKATARYFKINYKVIMNCPHFKNFCYYKHGYVIQQEFCLFDMNLKFLHF